MLKTSELIELSAEAALLSFAVLVAYFQLLQNCDIKANKPLFKTVEVWMA